MSGCLRRYFCKGSRFILSVCKPPTDGRAISYRENQHPQPQSLLLQHPQPLLPQLPLPQKQNRIMRMMIQQQLPPPKPNPQLFIYERSFNNVFETSGRCFRLCFILHYMAAAEKCYRFFADKKSGVDMTANRKFRLFPLNQVPFSYCQMLLSAFLPLHISRFSMGDRIIPYSNPLK